MTPTECRKAIQEKREQRAEIQARLANATGKEKLTLRLEDARLAEDINTLGRVLRDLMPQHHIGEKRNGERTGARRAKSGGWSKLETMTWNEIGLKTWAELETMTNSEEISRMARAARETMNECSSILSEKQYAYFTATGKGMEHYGRGDRTQREVAAEAGVDHTTVSRTVQRARGRIRTDAQQRYTALKNACENGGVRLDVSDRETMELLLSTLTERQLLYMVLYYGNWMSTREVGRCLDVDHATVARTIGRGLKKLSTLVAERTVELSGVPALEMRIMEYLNGLPPEAPNAGKGRPKPRQGRGKRFLPLVSERTLTLRRGYFLSATEKGELGEWLRREKGLHALVLRAIAALKSTIKRKRGERA